jgi:hypothetical protein
MTNDNVTLGQAHAGRWRLFVHCAWGKRLGMKSIRECISSAELDLETLIWTRGKDFPVDKLTSQRLRCPKCRSLRVRLRWVCPDADEATALRRAR